jgi:gamma-glutamyltranspeptidase
MAMFGERSITVPGAVAGWHALSTRLGRLGLDQCVAPAIAAARNGLVAGFESAYNWGRAERAPKEFGHPLRFGERYRARSP